jgi:hypothetical protein
MSILKAIDKTFNNVKKRNWDQVYFYFDIHETILYPDYNNVDTLKFYEHAKEVLQYLSARKDITIALYTCSYPKEIERYIEFFKSHGIDFKYVNRNPDAKNTLYGFYEDKPYFNVLFEDKAGFDAENDWLEIKKYFGIQ